MNAQTRLFDNSNNLPQLPKPPSLTAIYGIGCGMQARDFFALLKKFKVTRVVDTRLSPSYRGYGFGTSESDFEYLCELHGIHRNHIEELAPLKAMRETLRTAIKTDKMAWTNFLHEYTKLITRERRILREGSPTRKIVYGNDTTIAMVCSCGHPRDCHRSALVGVLGTFIEGISTRQLMLSDIGKNDPKRKSPRRYLFKPIKVAGLDTDLPRRKQHA